MLHDTRSPRGRDGMWPQLGVGVDDSGTMPAGTGDMGSSEAKGCANTFYCFECDGHTLCPG